MHGSIRDRLENLLAEENSARERQDVGDHLSSCAECSTELQAMKKQANLLGLLRAPEDAEPSVGFYARVIQRIEERGTASVWSLFVNSAFSKRLAYGSLAVALLLGTYLVTEESQDGHLGSSLAARQTADITPVIGDQQEQRDAVLVNFASYQPSIQPSTQQGTAQ